MYKFLSIKIDKSNFMSIYKPCKLSMYNIIDFKTFNSDRTLGKVTKIKQMGVIIKNNFNFKQHYYKTMSKKTYLFWKIWYFTTQI